MNLKKPPANRNKSTTLFCRNLTICLFLFIAFVCPWIYLLSVVHWRRSENYNNGASSSFVSGGATVTKGATTSREAMMMMVEKESLIKKKQSSFSSTDYSYVVERIKYWHPNHTDVKRGFLRLPPSDRYVVFLSDCGGFNNIRQAFEYFFMFAWLTRRTLVLPPPEGWYLIDFGPMQVMKPSENEKKYTEYSEFFELEDMKAGIFFFFNSP